MVENVSRPNVLFTSHPGHIHMKGQTGFVRKQVQGADCAFVLGPDVESKGRVVKGGIWQRQSAALSKIASR